VTAEDLIALFAAASQHLAFAEIAEHFYVHHRKYRRLIPQRKNVSAAACEDSAQMKNCCLALHELQQNHV
jgi:hypothetical protein